MPMMTPSLLFGRPSLRRLQLETPLQTGTLVELPHPLATERERIFCETDASVSPPPGATRRPRPPQRDPRVHLDSGRAGPPKPGPRGDGSRRGRAEPAAGTARNDHRDLG